MTLFVRHKNSIAIQGIFIFSFLSLFLFFSSCNPGDEGTTAGESGARSYREASRSVDIGFFIGMPRPTSSSTEEGELLPDTIISWEKNPEGYSGDFLIGRDKNGFDFNKYADRLQEDFYIKAKVIDQDLYNNVPTKMTLNKGYFLSLIQADCPENYSIKNISVDDASDGGKETGFCVGGEAKGSYSNGRQVVIGKVTLKKDIKYSGSPCNVEDYIKAYETDVEATIVFAKKDGNGEKSFDIGLTNLKPKGNRGNRGCESQVEATEEPDKHSGEFVFDVSVAVTDANNIDNISAAGSCKLTLNVNSRQRNNPISIKGVETVLASGCKIGSNDLSTMMGNLTNRNSSQAVSKIEQGGALNSIDSNSFLGSTFSGGKMGKILIVLEEGEKGLTGGYLIHYPDTKSHTTTEGANAIWKMVR